MADPQGSTTAHANNDKVDELRSKLSRLGLPIHGVKAVLQERLRRHSEGTGEIPNTGGVSEKRPEKEIVPPEEVSNSTVRDLKRRLATLGLKITGSKANLTERLQTALDSNDELPEGEVGDDVVIVGEEDDTIRERHVNVNQRGQEQGEQIYRYPRATLSFKDVEDALETFSGDKGENISRWLSTFEETAETCAWSNAKKIVYAKKWLQGSAKLFANFEAHAKTWTELRKALVTEFTKTVNSKQVHTQLIVNR